jgi:hypothetical protein
VAIVPPPEPGLIDLGYDPVPIGILLYVLIGLFWAFDRGAV